MILRVIISIYKDCFVNRDFVIRLLNEVNIFINLFFFQ